MPGFEDSAIIVLLALLLFGPKKLPELARQFGKLMSDFRRASSEFRTQMEEELRVSEQAERQKQIAAIEAAAPSAPILDPTPAIESEAATPALTSLDSASEATPEAEPAPLPIATSGELSILPPSTGLPIANSAPDSLPDPSVPHPSDAHETEVLHG